MLIVLRAPDGEFALLDHLGFENALDGFIDGEFGAGAFGIAEEYIVGAARRDVAQGFQDADHGVVIVGNVAPIPVAKGIELRPSAVGILRLEQVLEAAPEALREARIFGGGVDLRQIAHLRVGSIVIDGGVRLGVALLLVELRPLRGSKRHRHIDVLVPAADVALVDQEVGGDAHRLVTSVPRGRLPHRIAPAHQFVK